MSLLVLGLVLFLGTHLVPVVVPVRSALRARLGEAGYKGLYALAAAIGLALIVIGYGQARAAGPDLLWTPPRALVHLNLLLMLPVFPLFAAAYLPGWIKAKVGHPMVTAVILWAFGHLLANGTVPDVLLFAGFLAWGIVDRISAGMRSAPAPAAAFGRNDIIAILVGLAVYGVVVARLHQWVIGVPVLP